MSTTMIGPALKGSRSCLQRTLGLDPDRLGDQIISASPALIAFDPSRVEWKSPLSGEDYREYRDDFLMPLGLARHEETLRRFWPLQGPQWDGLALLPSPTSTGVLLVEAKAHPSETESSCGAVAPASREKIAVAFDQVQRHMGVAAADWMTGHYQLANRLAFLYFLNEIVGAPAFLALVNFVDDRGYRPTRLADWRAHYQRVFGDMGLRPGCRMLERVVMLFPKAIPSRDPRVSEEASLSALRNPTGPMRLADRIRLFVITHYIEPALSRGETVVRIKSGQLHQQMGLENQMPSVCGALDTRLFEDLANVTLIRRDGPAQSSTVVWEFRARPASR